MAMPRTLLGELTVLPGLTSWWGRGSMTPSQTTKPLPSAVRTMGLQPLLETAPSANAYHTTLMTDSATGAGICD